ncbi:translesion DNA synthesis-associated protein ImuA [Undibacterium sp. SXout7W]|uniref:translesion DNA synthesis-associated protein ImuA n=1 Tax=Undibacterium sp. SXout7W TaxID=3413049 RepID=UPI003BF2A650
MLSQSHTYFNLPHVLGQMPHAIWRASEMAVHKTSTLSSGFTKLDAELPNGGWPRSALIELLVQQAGVGEMQFLKPILAAIAKTHRIALIQPPHIPNGLTCQDWNWPAERLIWIKTTVTADALWSAEQILKNGSCGAVLLWQSNIRSEALRRLNLAAQTTDTYFFLFRPISAHRDASPAPLRLSLRPARAGIHIEIIKRQGSHSDTVHLIHLPDMPVSRHINTTEHHHAHVDLPAPAIFAAGSHQTLLV